MNEAYWKTIEEIIFKEATSSEHTESRYHYISLAWDIIKTQKHIDAEAKADDKCALPHAGCSLCKIPEGLNEEEVEIYKTLFLRSITAIQERIIKEIRNGEINKKLQERSNERPNEKSNEDSTESKENGSSTRSLRTEETSDTEESSPTIGGVEEIKNNGSHSEYEESKSTIIKGDECKTESKA